MLVAALLWSCDQPKKEEEPPKETPPAEFADPKYMEMGKIGLNQLSSGDIDGWMTKYADNAKYYWSGGDSLVGKAAIANYWKDRRTNVIDSITFINDIWLAIKINKPQKGPDREGVWLMSWYQVKSKYKNGNSIFMWVHTDMHFDNNDMIDQVVQYIDRVPINAALAAKAK
jgi:hypothetical protein